MSPQSNQQSGESTGKTQQNQSGAQQGGTTQTRDFAPGLATLMNIDIDALAKANPSIEHNMREEWTALTAKTTEFYNKYGTGGTAQKN